MAHTTKNTEHSERQWFRFETYASGRRVSPAFDSSVYLTLNEACKLAWGICCGMRFKYRVPSVKVYDSENNLVKTCF